LRPGSPPQAFESYDHFLIFAFSVDSQKWDTDVRSYDQKQSLALKAEATKKVEPTLPGSASQSGLKGRVQVRVRVSPDGKVERASIANSSFPEVNNEVLTAARQWEFSPKLFAESKQPISGLLTFTLPVSGK
jgi:TonB family protein